MRNEMPPHLLIQGLENLLRGHEQIIRHHYAGSLLERVHYVLEHYQGLAANHLNGAEQFKADVLMYLRTFVLLVEMVGGAATHHEKDILARACVAQMQTAIEQIQKAKVELTYTRWSPPELWRSDYPVREYLRQIHQLRDRVKHLEEEKAAREAPPESTGNVGLCERTVELLREQEPPLADMHASSDDGPPPSDGIDTSMYDNEGF